MPRSFRGANTASAGIRIGLPIDGSHVFLCSKLLELAGRGLGQSSGQVQHLEAGKFHPDLGRPGERSGGAGRLAPGEEKRRPSAPGGGRLRALGSAVGCALEPTPGSPASSRCG